MLFAAYYNPETKRWAWGKIHLEQSRPGKKEEIYFEAEDWKGGFVYVHPGDPVLITSRQLDAVYTAGRMTENKSGPVIAYMRHQDCEWEAHQEELAGRRLV